MSALMEWLMTSLSGAGQHHLAPWAYWHARSMVLGWGVLIPVGALLARYFKVTPRQAWPQVLDSKMWWHGHRGLQCLGVLVITLGVMLAWGQGQSASPGAGIHAALGWAVVSLGWAQVAAGWWRGTKGGPTSAQLRGDHYDMTPHRIWFERLHKSLGWLAVMGATLAIVLGLFVADAPRWMLVFMGAWWFALAAAAWHWQRQGRCVDTYQAIWGPDAQHPGNRRQPIGWGVRRPLEPTQTSRQHG